MNQEFIQNALNNGEPGKQWLKEIPEIIKNTEKKWDLQVAPPFNLSYNYVAPATRNDGSPVVLKIGFPQDREFKTEIEALSVFNGDGIAKLLEVDHELSAILIERVTPGIPLSSLKDDDQATRIIASVMKKLWKPLPSNHKFITVRDWMRELPEYMEKYKNGNGPLPWHLVEKANSLFEELLATSQTPMLLHGDLHHDNILSSNRDSWLAIDPKGIAGEPEYETAAMIRNPYVKMTRNPQVANIIKSRIMILAEELDFDPQRIQKWCLAQTVLSAVWNEKSPKGAEHAITIAEVLDMIKI